MYEIIKYNKFFEQVSDLDPYSEENWEEGKYDRDNLPLRPDGRIDSNLIDSRLVGNPRLIDELPKATLDQLIGKKVVRITDSDSDEGFVLHFDNGDTLEFGYSGREGFTNLNGVPVIMDND